MERARTSFIYIVFTIKFKYLFVIILLSESQMYIRSEIKNLKSMQTHVKYLYGCIYIKV